MRHRRRLATDSFPSKGLAVELVFVEMAGNDGTVAARGVRRRGCHDSSSSSHGHQLEPETIQRRHHCPSTVGQATAAAAAAELRNTEPPRCSVTPTWIAPRSLLKKIHTGGRVILFLSVSLLSNQESRGDPE